MASLVSIKICFENHIFSPSLTQPLFVVPIILARARYAQPIIPLLWPSEPVPSFAGIFLKNIEVIG
mgnify:CR=1 FL=1